MIDVDKALLKLGRFGRYQMMAFNLGTATWTFCGMQMMSMAFTNTLPPFQCFPESTEATVAFDGECDRSWNTSGVIGVEHCNSSQAVFHPTFGYTIANQWHLICDARYLLEFTTSLFMFGNLVGAFLIPPFADRWGRKWLLLACLWAMGILGILSAVMPSFVAFAAMRFLGGCAYSVPTLLPPTSCLLGVLKGIACVGWVLACEVIEPQLRAYATIGMGLWWTLGYVIVGPLAYALPDWRLLTLATSIPLVLTLSYIWLLPESPHWLTATHQHAATVEWFAKAAKFNGQDRLKLEDCELVSLEEKAPPKSRHIGHLCLSPILLSQTLIMSYLWLCNTFVYYGLSLFSTELLGDRYFNYILSGLVELPVYFIVCPMMNNPRLGRRWTIAIFHLIAGLALLSLIFIPPDSEDGTSYRWLATVLWLVGKSAITGTFASIFVFGAEIFPTTLRTLGLGLCSTASKIGGVLAPYIRLAGLIDKRLPAILFGGSSLIAAAATLLLPETVGRKLPEDLHAVRPGPFFKLFLSDKKQKTVDSL